MSRCVTKVADRFPDFNTFCPNDTGFSCVHPCKAEPFLRCTRSLGRGDRADAARLRTVLSCAAFDNANSLRLMENYVKLCCCKRTHRATALDIRVVEHVAQRWVEQLYGPQAFLRRSEFVATKQSFGEDRPGKRISTGQHHVATTTPIDQQRAPTTDPDSSMPHMIPVKSLVKTNFFPYTSDSLAEMLEIAILSPIHQARSRSGTLYMFRSEADLGFVKIGYTTRGVRYKACQHARRMWIHTYSYTPDQRSSKC